MLSKSKARTVRRAQLDRLLNSLPGGAGDTIKGLNPEEPFYKQERKCEYCGKQFLPPQFPASGLVRFCGKSCSAKWRMRQPEYIARVHTPEVAAKRGRKKAAWFAANSPKALKEKARIAAMNPMADPAVREKVSRILKDMEHGPHVRGGNGSGMTEPQRIMKDILGDGWLDEYALSLGRQKKGYPSNYKLDLADPLGKINIEVDGFSHKAVERKNQDRKRDAMLTSMGWTIIRLWNKDILEWKDSGYQANNPIFETLRKHNIAVSLPCTDEVNPR